MDDDYGEGVEKRDLSEAFEGNKQKAMNTSQHTSANYKIPSQKSKCRKKRKRAIPVTKITKQDNSNKICDTVLRSTITAATSNPSADAATTNIGAFTNTTSDGNNINRNYTDDFDQQQQQPTTDIPTDIHKNESEIDSDSLEPIDINAADQDSSNMKATQMTGESNSPMIQTPPSVASPSSSVKKESGTPWIHASIDTACSSTLITTTDVATKKTEAAPPLSPSAYPSFSPTRNCQDNTIKSDHKTFAKRSHSPLQQALNGIDLAYDLKKLRTGTGKTELSFLPPTVSPEETTTSSYPPASSSPSPSPSPSPSTAVTVTATFSPTSASLSSPDSSISYPPETPTTTAYPQKASTASSYQIESASTIHSPESVPSAYSPKSNPTCDAGSTTVVTSYPEPIMIESDILVVEDNPKMSAKLKWNAENESYSKSHDHDPISTYSPDNIFQFQHEGEICYCIGFEKNQKLVFIGYALIGALYGSIEMNGATISAKSNLPSCLNLFSRDISQYVNFHPVFSPRTSGLTVIQSVCYEKVATSSPSTTLNSNFDDLAQVLEPLEERWERFESVIMVKRLDWCGVEQLEQVMPSLQNAFRLGTKDGYIANDGPFFDDMVGFQPIMHVTPEVKALQNQPSWKISIDRLLEYEQVHDVPSISIICGNKNVNKSTFARYMINRLLKTHYRVAYLEADVGQTEFTPTGLVALHVIDTPLLGPSFTHPHLKCKQSYFIGTTTCTQMDSTYYQACVKQLLSRYRQDCEEWTKIARQDDDGSYLMPLVVNTHGWISGVGYDSLLALMEFAKPSHIFGLTSPTCFGYMPEGDFPSDFAHRAMMVLPQHLPVSQQLMFLTAPTPTSELIEQHHYRQLMLLSYLYHNPQTFGQASSSITHKKMNDDGNNNNNYNRWWQVTPPLIHRTPWIADWREQINSVWVFYDEVPPSQLLYVLNGALVGLVGQIRSLDDDGDVDDLIVIEEKSSATTINKEQQKQHDNQALQKLPMKTKVNKNHLIIPSYHSAKTSTKPNPSTTTCFGLGVVRAIDPERQQFHVITPLSTDRLGQVTQLVKGDLELPVFCMLDPDSIRTHQKRGVF